MINNRFISIQSDLIVLAIIIAAAIVIIFLSIFFYKRNINQRKYNRKLKYINRIKESTYNANILIDQLYNQYSIDNTNTYASLKSKGRRIIKKYFKFYQKQLSELVILKSILSPNRKQNILQITFKNKNNETLGEFHLNQGFNRLKKLIDKHQLLFDCIAYLYELTDYIDQKKPYHLVNHDNGNILTYKIIDEIKK